MTIRVTFPGGVGVNASLNGHSVHTDQPPPLGMDSAPSPFDLFLLSIATCAGFYALRFCQQRALSTEGLGVSVDVVRESDGKHVSDIRIEVQLPAGFPDKYQTAIVRSIDQCAVKRHIIEPPRFEVTAVTRPGDVPNFALAAQSAE